MPCWLKKAFGLTIPQSVLLRAHEVIQEASCWLIAEWYYLRRLAGAARHSVVESILMAVAAQDESGVAALQLGRRHEH